MSNKKAKLSNVNTSSSIPARSNEPKAAKTTTIDPPTPPASPKAAPFKAAPAKAARFTIAGNGMLKISVRGEDGKRRRVPTGEPVELTPAEVAYLDKVSIPYTR